MTSLIIGIGNRHQEEDALGCRVYDWLLTQPLPKGVTVVEGGLQGLNLLSLLEGYQRVVFADALASGAVTVLGGAEVAAMAEGYGHGAGLPYLLALLPAVLEPPLPVCHVVGAAGPPTPALVAAVGRACLEVATHAEQ